MRRVSEKELSKSLSNDDIERNGLNFITYPELKSKKLGDLKLPLCVLYMNGKNYGHYTCLFMNSEGLNMFDSYGGKPDSEFKWANKKLNFKGKPYISKLLSAFGGHVIYNEVPLQSSDESVATCGRWCIARVKYSELKQDEFVKFVNNCAGRLNITRDELMVLMTRDGI